MALTFESFQELPAELRAHIWEYALHDEQCKPDTRAWRQFELHDYDPCANTISVHISTPYPALYAVNRESRYEAAKLDGCDRVPIHSSHCGRSGSPSGSKFVLCMNFSRDVIHLAEESLTASQLKAWNPATNTPEHYRLRTLTYLFDHATINRIEHLSLWTRPPQWSHRLEDVAWWRGEGLEIFCLGNLQSIRLLAMKPEHAEWAKLIVEDHLEYHWVTDGWRTSRPVVRLG